MAEAFGVISGALSVVSLAIQIADSIKRLKDFCDLVKEAPDEVRLALDEVEVLSLVLQDIEHSMYDQSTCVPAIKAAVMRSLHLCRVSSDALLTIARDLYSDMAGGKRWSSFKAALRKDNMMKFRARLEGAKTTLMLANQRYYHAIQRRDWELQRRDINELKITLSAMSISSHKTRPVCHENDEKNNLEPGNEEESQMPRVLEAAIDSPIDYGSARLTSDCAQILWKRRLFGPVECSKAIRSSHRKAIPTIQSSNEGELDEMRVTIRLPTWLLPRRYQFRARRAYSGWEYSLRSSCIVSPDSLVFQFSQDGNKEGLKELFNTRIASPFDADIDGFTPLHYAVISARPQVVRFLLENGADANAWSNYSYCDTLNPLKKWINNSTPLLLLTSGGGCLTFRSRDVSLRSGIVKSLGDPVSEDEYVEILRLLVNDTACDPLQADLHGKNAMQRYRGPVKGLSWLISQIESFEIQALVKEPLWFGFYNSRWDHTADLIRTIITSQVLRDSVFWPDQNGYRILNHTLLRWMDENLYMTFEYSPWEQLLREIVQAGVDIHSTLPDGTTPFQMILRRSQFIMRDWHIVSQENSTNGFRRRIRELLARWLWILQGEGVDIQQYSKQESKLWDAERMLNSDGIVNMKIHTHGWVDIKWNSPDDPCSEGGDWTDGLGERLGQFWRLVRSEIDEDEFLDFSDGDSGILTPIFISGEDSHIEDEGDNSGKNPPRLPGSWDYD